MIKKIMGLFDENKRDLKKLEPLVKKINEIEPLMQKLSDVELKAKTPEFQARVAAGETLDQLLPEAFAVVREAAVRVLGMRHYDVQLIGGIVLHQGRVAEMKTGEGKTLVATLPCYLNALTGDGVHVITVNDYLARRDSEWMGPLYEFLGLSTGLIIHGVEPEVRREEYKKDIIYGTNNEFGFDYLRDNMANTPERLVQQKLNYVIVDEVDSILIDEARTPLIISGQADKPTELYYTIAKMIPMLKRDVDFTVEEKEKNVILTEEGLSRVEKILGVDSIYEGANAELGHHVNQGLKAHMLMKKDVNYVVRDGEVVIVDEFTGRLMFGRRYSAGLHQAIEAKENVKIARESQTLATITFQNYFRMYKKLSGMTGTAKTEEQEFTSIYGTDVVVIPTNKPTVRIDADDRVYRTEQGKYEAVVEEIVERHAGRQPVLVGTISIENSEMLGRMLDKKKINYQILNAKHHEQEAEIVSRAGEIDMVTIATNMAGRGTDIVLGEGVKELGGLHIVGTERHESRRIDNQLRGRAGRQGDPGSSVFFVSMEDKIMRLFGGENMKGLMDKMGMDDSMPINHPLLSKSIESAQKKVEARNFDIRKNVLEYDNVMNQQREVIYKQRRQVLMEENLREQVLGMIDDVIRESIGRFDHQSEFVEEWDLDGLLAFASQTYFPANALKKDELLKLSPEEVAERFIKQAHDLYRIREQKLTEEVMRKLERIVLLKVVDEKWMDHIDAMDDLKDGIGLRAYGQRDPLVEFKFEGYDMFENMIASIKEDVTRLIYRVMLVEPQQTARNLHQNRGEDTEKKPVQRSKKIGRNEPCPCGSGKKYKHCCGK
ncbi:preprotein translocase subunit SecA [Clostridia bacterium]|nr:preprotein translocase subunit SecA [Clostridia bacterium]